jgi:Ni/Co efflux regulator RcnB
MQECAMKHLILPAVSALLLAGLPAQAQSLHPQSYQLAQNDRGGDHGQGDQKRSGEGGTKGDNQKGAGNSGHGDMTRPDRGSTQGAGVGGASRNGTATGSPVSLSGSGQGGATMGTTHTARVRNGGASTTGGSNQGGAAMGTTHTARVRNGGTSASGGFNQGGAAMGTTNAARIHKGGTATTGAFNQGGAAMGTNRPAASSTFHARPSNWNNYPRQFDRNVYQRNVTAPRSYHWQSYNRPSGWYYQRWVYGQIFPRIFWGRDYWLNDYWMFDLPIPPYGYVWVRYGDDAVLINRRTGEVLQVEYGLFD